MVDVDVVIVVVFVVYRLKDSPLNVYLHSGVVSVSMDAAEFLLETLSSCESRMKRIRKYICIYV